MSAMKAINVEKLVINMGTGSDENIQHNAKRLLEIVTGRKPADAYSKKRNPAFKISKGQKIGAFVTIRGKEIRPIATKMLDAIDSRLKESSVSNNSLSFGIREYIDIAGVKYDPKIGMLGMNVNITFQRKGRRVEIRKIRVSKIPKKHGVVTRDEIKDYMKKEYKVEFV